MGSEGLRRPRWSPNRSARPKGATIDTILLHGTGGGSFRSNVAWLKDPASRVSAHFVIGPSGEIAKLVPLSQAAWHAAPGRHPEVKPGLGINQRSIGIELVHPNDSSPFPAAQLRSLENLLFDLKAAFPSLRWLLGHKHVAPRRKPFCPGPALDIDSLAAKLGLRGPGEIRK